LALGGGFTGRKGVKQGDFIANREFWRKEVKQEYLKGITKEMIQKDDTV